ncbi:alanine racemase [Cognatishimia sp. F0-27]|uniref:alanine racemase n=1 Tax=Cognatishimia sp. F0-27 TaxID=2816855 RepID=UPI001D0C1B4D|nr:alanine racemase [Cognatishimia sp. F0-27]MCC1493457.1 alanine racemase [Cognatishimia sp. F0-27]
MAQALLDIDLSALVANWRALAAMARAEAGAVVKADAYGLGVVPVSKALAEAGARRFFVALAEEGAALRTALGDGIEINVFSGHMEGDAALIRDAALTPMINSAEQWARHRAALPHHPFGIQLDSGMNRLGIEPADWAALRDAALAAGPALVMSHLACADEPDHAMNATQLSAFRAMTDGIDAPRSLAATGGTLLGEDYHFDVIRPGIGVYGGAPYAQARAVVALHVPVIQTRTVLPGETVGYGNTWRAERPTRVATISAGYADGLIRAMGPQASFRSDDTPCKVLGRISMDLIGVDVSDCAEPPQQLTLLDSRQGVDRLADWAGTIGYEILTSLGARYDRRYHG